MGSDREKRTEDAIRDMIYKHPGIRAKEIAEQLNITKGRVSQVVSYLKSNDIIIQVEAKGIGGYELHPRPSESWLRMKMIRTPWVRKVLIVKRKKR